MPNTHLIKLIIVHHPLNCCAKCGPDLLGGAAEIQNIVLAGVPVYKVDVIHHCHLLCDNPKSDRPHDGQGHVYVHPCLHTHRVGPART